MMMLLILFLLVLDCVAADRRRQTVRECCLTFELLCRFPLGFSLARARPSGCLPSQLQLNFCFFLRTMTILLLLGCVWRDDDVRDSMNSLGFLFCFVFTTTTTSMTFSLYAQFSISPCTRCTRMLSPSLSFFLRLNVCCCCCCLHLSSDNEWIGVYPSCDIQRPYVPCPSWVFGYFRKRLTTVWPGWISLYDCKLLYPVQHNCTQST